MTDEKLVSNNSNSEQGLQKKWEGASKVIRKYFKLRQLQ